MKKLLSFVLVLAMIFSCVSMISFSVNAETEEFVGVKLTALKDITAGSYYRVTKRNFTVDDVVDGAITVTYRIYNSTGRDLSCLGYLQDGWGTLNDIDADAFPKAETNPTFKVPGFGYADVTMSVPVDVETGKLKTDKKDIPVGNVTVRFDVNGNANNLKTGEAVYLTSDDAKLFEGDGNGFFGVEKITADQIPTATKKGIKFYMVDSAKTADSMTPTSGGVFAADATFTGTKTVSWYVYNPSDVTTTFEISLQGAVPNGAGGNGWYAAKQLKGKTVYSIPAQSGTIVSLSVPVTNGMVRFDDKTTATNEDFIERSMSILFIRLKSQTTTKAPIIFMANGDNDPIYTLKSYKNAAFEYVSEVPEIATKTLGDGTVESENTTGWGGQHNGKFERVAGGANGSAYAAKAVITGRYQTIAYDFAPFIINYPELGYEGHGVEEYTVSFWAKAAEGKSGTFNFGFNSKLHLSAAEVKTILGADYPSVDTYYQVQSFAVTDQWQKFTFDFKIRESLYKELIELAKVGYPEALGLNLRFDNSGGAFKNEVFDYYLDDVVIEKQPDPIARRITSLVDRTSKIYPRTVAGFTDADVVWDENSTGDGTEHTTKTGTITTSYTFINDTYEAKSIEVYYYGGNRGGSATTGWENIEGRSGFGSVVVEAQSSVTRTLSFPVYKFSDGQTVIVIDRKLHGGTANDALYQGVAGYAPLNTVYFRLDFGTNWSKDYNLIIAADEDDPLFKLAADSLKFDNLYELPTLIPPKGVEYKVVEEIKGGYTYWRRENLNITAADAVDGVITKQYEVYNTSDKAINLQLQFQNVWSDIGQNVGHTILANSKKLYTFTLKLNENGNFVYNGKEISLSDLTFRVNYSIENEFEVGDSFIVAPLQDNDFILRMVGNGTPYDFDEVTNGDGVAVPLTGKATGALAYVLPEGYVEATPTPTPIPTPAPTKEVTNGDVENGKTGWGIYNGGTANVVVDPDDETNHVIEFVPAGNYNSVAFDFGPAIIQDELAGYYGAGAESYLVTFRAKAEKGKGGSFGFVLNSQQHNSKGNNFTVNGEVVQIPTHSYISGLGSAELTDQWQTFSFVVPVTAEFLETINIIRNCSNAGYAKKAYQLVLRLDGATAAFDTDKETDGVQGFEGFTYYIDDAKIELEPDHVGLKLEAKNDNIKDSVDSYMRTNINADSSIYGTTVTTKYTVYNPMHYDIEFEMMYQRGWNPVISDEVFVIPACGSHEYVLSFTTDADGYLIDEEGNFIKYEKTVQVEIEEGVFAEETVVEEKLHVSELTLRAQFNHHINKGDYVIIAAEEGDVVYNLGSEQSATKNIKTSGVYELPSYINFYGANVSLGEGLTVNFSVLASDIPAGTEKVTATFTRNGNTITVDGVLDGEFYTFAYTGINPQCMGDAITAVVLADGKAIGAKADYSVLKNVMNLQAAYADNTALVTLLSDLLVYGKEAQLYTGYNTEALVTDGIEWLTNTVTDFSLLNKNVTITGNTDANNKVDSVTLNLANVNKIKFVLNVTDTENVTAFINGEAVALDSEIFTAGLAPLDYDNTFKFELKQNGKTISTVNYSVNTYVARMYTDELVGAISQALYNYGVAAEAYYNSIA